ncbi:MAG: FKBP-type peptidyl-prolyl cis-trans isomerase [Bacteroidales bacterium]|nr:FKBP-type peptidyl-prolyl cis-trans isomerase [Bacteroidales bacterium]
MAHKKKLTAADIAAYKQENEDYLRQLKSKPDYRELRCGVFYKVLQEAAPVPADATERQRRKLEACPQPRSIVTVHYAGRLINGKQFDSSRRGAGTPVAFRVNELITGWQVALVNMHIGERWEIVIPSEAGYGERGAGRDIPGHSTLVFELELLDIA